MKHQDSHVADQLLLQYLDGELAAADAARVAAHLLDCWQCRLRRREMEAAIGDYVRTLEHDLPPAEGPEALLRARLAELSRDSSASWMTDRKFSWAAVAIAACLCVAAVQALRSDIRMHRQAVANRMVVSVPDPKLTPGAAVLLSRSAVCTQNGTNNKDVPASLQRKVFEAYGIAGAEPKEYEVDYLITPALGGADDIHNLWPQSHSATVWNSEVKDALEIRLRQMVCEGTLDLSEAQQEIAGNWVEAYKKYFHTDTPLADHEPLRN